MSAKKVALSGMFAALGIIFSYIEYIFPFQTGVPGVKLGLANLVIVVALYRMSAKDALVINFIRILVSGLLFTGLSGTFYSLCGSLCSFAVMALFKKTNRFSVIGVSMAGGVFHNFGQLIAAMIMVSTTKLFYYFPVLLFSGLIAGIIVGIGGTILLNALPAGRRAAKRIQIRGEPGRMQTDTRALKAAKVQALWCSLERRTSAGDGNIRYESFVNRNKGFEKDKFRLYKPRTL